MRFLIIGRVFFACFLAAIAAGCATSLGGDLAQVPRAAKTPEETVLARAQERWDALKAGQYDKAYSYITPTTRKTLPVEVFRGRIAGASWLDVKVVKAVCEPEVCDVSVKLDYYVLPNLRDSQTVDEKWILDGGNWWFVYRG
ncbi:MAG: hypothetical protein IPP88_05510 [Betaproteobacteria bacterium]|nr:hypothetical protein [Betaproteobacteria bacterium]